MSFLLRRVLAILLIAGLGVSPLYAATMKGMEQSAQASSMAGMADDMPCHPAKPSNALSDKAPSDKAPFDKAPSDKPCPFMVACLSLCCQGMPPVFGAIVAPVTVGLRTPFESVRQLTSLAPSPPARPPRA